MLRKRALICRRDPELGMDVSFLFFVYNVPSALAYVIDLVPQ